MADVRDALIIGKRSDGKLVQRPLSPHLQIYKPQISTATSIFHRITGCALAVGLLLMVWWLVAAATGPRAFASAQGFVGSPIGLILMFGWTLALWYHFCNGIRHLFWDAGFGFDVKTSHRNAFAVLVATVVLTVLSWVVGLAVWL
ncbi:MULTISPECIES: succinate dehydrogenase, cytochrome b556 subunit [unclassified Acidisoma]|jgi:succinate dehydrogenase / fumarate reductase cytochrome b subunit|uniref:succinate dehydrogenase, cytochrome b556 subunit n=1 Tax=unclassified Acidisoma TaxID=2634065 RepID=UPI00131BE745|nr:MULTISPECIES: succinate dehydrogenase, cytochrome b556 subunit [unclassified Acidisoma]